jgi:hypothetical protein
MAYVIIGKEKLFIKQNESGRVKYHKTCIVCGIKFISARKTAKFCSNACKQRKYYNSYMYDIPIRSIDK